MLSTLSATDTRGLRLALAFHSTRHWQHARGLRLEFRRWQHTRGLRPELTSIRPALATRSGASPRIGIYSLGISNTLEGYSNNGFFHPGKSEPLLPLIVGFRSQVISDSGPAVPQFRFGSNFEPPESNSILTYTLKIPEFWWQYTNSDAVCQIRR
jgi:hypothetical protein